MSVSIEQNDIAGVIGQQIEGRLVIPVVRDLYSIYNTSGCLNSLAWLVQKMPESERDPLIHTLGSHVTKEKPVFVYAVCDAKGLDQPQSATLAASVDMLWALSLIVDDIEDNDKVRAGKESAWTKFGKSKALASVESGVAAVREGLEENFGTEGWQIMDDYINKALASVRQHKTIRIDDPITNLVLNYTDRNDFYCASPVDIISKANSLPVDDISTSALRKVTLGGQVLNDLKDIWPQFKHIRPGYSDIRNRLVTIPVKQMFDHFDPVRQEEFLRLWNTDPHLVKPVEEIVTIVKKSGIKDQVLENIRQTYQESENEFETGVANPIYRNIFGQWVSYKLGQCESLI